MSERSNNLRVLMISLIATVLIAEGFLRVFDLGFGSNPMVGHPVLQHAHPKNYRFRVHSPIDEFGGHIMVYDSRGLRVPDRPLSAETPKKVNVLALGDSFTEARQVDFEHSFVGRLGHIFPDTQFYNYGNASYSPVVSYLQLKTDAAEDLERAVAVFHLLYSNDSEDDARYIRNAVFGPDGDIVALPGNKNLLVEILRNFYVARLVKRALLIMDAMIEVSARLDVTPIPGLDREASIYYLYEDRRMEDLTREYLLKVKNFLAEREVTYLLSCVPSKLMTNHKIKATGNFCSQAREWALENNVAYVDLTEKFYSADKPLFFERDIHFNEAGHEIVAQTLANRLATGLGGRAIEIDSQDGAQRE